DAERDLTAMGRAAREALLDGANASPDPEVRARSRGLLTRAINLEMKARLDTFLADTEGKYEHDLPGWNRLRATVRGDFSMFGWTWTGKGTVSGKAARELFVEFLNAPNGRKLLAALGSGAGDLGPAVASLKQELYYARIGRGTAPRAVTAMEVAVVLFVDSQVRAAGGQRNTLFSSVLTTSGVIQATNGTDGRAQALKAILIAWIDTRTDAYEMYSAMNLASNAGSNDVAVRVAVRLLGSPSATPLYRGYAFNTLARTQSKEHLPAVEKLIGDETVVTTRSTNVGGQIVRTTITLGDMALAAAVTMTGQKVDSYHIEDHFKGNGTTSITYTRYSIPEDKRKDAAAKWKAWRENNP
ncbi:MAG: hypothetical protein ACKODX_19075, partial [Gemmata sp.]